MEKKELILSLIKDDLVSSKLLKGLMELGLDTSNYFLHLSETIFKLMDFDDGMVTDDIFNRYLQLTQRAKYIDLSGNQLEKLANEIYLELTSMKTCSYENE